MDQTQATKRKRAYSNDEKRSPRTDSIVVPVLPMLMSMEFGKRRCVYVPRNLSTTPSSLPIPGCFHDCYMKVNFIFSPLPKYKKVSLDKLVCKMRYKSFVRDVDKMREEKDLPPLSRFEMEAAWYQKVYAHWKAKGVEIPKDSNETRKLQMKHFFFGAAMRQRRSMESNELWDEKKKKYPDLDDEARSDDTEGNRLQDLVEEWAAFVMDGEDPRTHYPFKLPQYMPPEEVNFIKITYEASLEKGPVELAVRTKAKETEGGKDTEGAMEVVKITKGFADIEY